MKLGTFRSKLLGALLLVIGGVSAASFLLMQQQVRNSHRSFFNELFRREFAEVGELQSLRLKSLQERVASLTRSVRLLAALDEAEDAATYELAASELGVLRLWNPEAPDRQTDPNQALLFRLFDASGKLLIPPSAAVATFPGSTGNAMEHALANLRSRFKQLPVQANGLVAIDVGTTEPQLYEYLFQKVIDRTSQEAAGGIFILLPMRPALAQRARTGSEVGFLVGGKVFPWSGRVLEENRSAVEQQFSKPLSLRREEVALQGTVYRIGIGPFNERGLFEPVQLITLYPRTRELEELTRVRRMIFLVTGGAALLAGLISIMMARRFSRPVQQLASAAAQIEQGNYECRVRIETRDELAGLGNAFNSMAAGLALKEKFKSVLNKVTDPEIAAELMEGKLKLGGEARVVTVLFCDIRGFTAASEGRDPAEVVEMLNEHMSEMAAVIARHRGVVDKYVGDLVMALFGAPKSYGNDAAAAVHCAIEMIQAREGLNQRSRFHIQIGIGIATGSVVAGCMGSEDRLNYTVIGDHVNLASRLCSKAGPMEILVDQTTAIQVPGAPLIAKPAMALKGYSAPVTVYSAVPGQGATRPVDTHTSSHLVS
jgi:class 3 adenylate cyclase